MLACETRTLYNLVSQATTLVKTLRDVACRTKLESQATKPELEAWVSVVSCPDYIIFAKRENSLVPQLPIQFWFQYFEITMTSRQLDSKNTLENSQLRDSLLVLLL